jgi:hypothetical protein
MKIQIVGGKGNMGTRYARILRYLGVETVLVDVGDDLRPGCDGVIIATPTSTHAAVIPLVCELGVPILCEKPICTDLPTLMRITDGIRAARLPSFSMIHQYRQFPVIEGCGISLYSYFKHGNDGLVWDCFQIIALAKAKIILEESSPIWQCQINGVPLDLNKMDMAYVLEIRQWLECIRAKIQPPIDLEYIERSHKKVAEYAARNKA